MTLAKINTQVLKLHKEISELENEIKFLRQSPIR